MRFEWDDEKRDRNLRKHGLDFRDVPAAFAQETLTIRDQRFDYGEVRCVTFSILEGVVVAVVHTETDELVRVISFRKATLREQKYYYAKIRD